MSGPFVLRIETLANAAFTFSFVFINATLHPTFLFLLSILNRHSFSLLTIIWWYCLLPASESHRSAYSKYSWHSFKLSREIHFGAGGQI